MTLVKKLHFHTLLLFLLMILISGCYKGKSVDIVIHNARIHTMNESDAIFEAIAIKAGKIIEVGPEQQILNKYTSKEEIDAGGKDIYPGFTDVHGHIIDLAQKKLSVDLTGTRSYDELLMRLEKYSQLNSSSFIIGRGLDTSLWSSKEKFTNERLNSVFSKIPVCLYYVGDEVVVVNKTFLTKSKIESKDGIIKGNLIEQVAKILPSYSKHQLKKTILEIQNQLFQYGITGVHEAGIEFADIAFFKDLIDKHDFRLNLYAMLLPSRENIAFARKNGIYSYKNLLIRSFKLMADGALGSRGAFLKKPYADQHGHYGVLTTPVSEMKKIASICEETGYQMNTHAIGDSTNAILLDLYARIFEVNKDHRWRIEHAQVIDPEDFSLFAKNGVFPSVQPVHAVSDQRWAEQRLGRKRMLGAYAYRTLMNQYGMLAIGTDFPVESIDPFLTIHAAVNRKNAEGIPGSGFCKNEQITLSECLKGMTSWAAFASFQENQLGTLEKGKDATFTILERPISANPDYEPNFSMLTMIKGKVVYTAE